MPNAYRIAPLGLVYANPDIKPILAKAKVIINPDVMVIKNSVAIFLKSIPLADAIKM